MRLMLFCLLYTSAMNLGKKAQLTYIFAPRAEEVYSSKSEPFMYKCAKLKTVILTNVKSM